MDDDILSYFIYFKLVQQWFSTLTHLWGPSGAMAFDFVCVFFIEFVDSARW